MTIRLYDNDTGKELGTLTESQLQFLVDQLEEETADDQDYYLNAATLEMLAGRTEDTALIARLKEAMGDRPGIEVRWERDEG